MGGGVTSISKDWGAGNGFSTFSAILHPLALFTSRSARVSVCECMCVCACVILHAPAQFSKISVSKVKVMTLSLTVCLHGSIQMIFSMSHWKQVTRSTEMRESCNTSAKRQLRSCYMLQLKRIKASDYELPPVSDQFKLWKHDHRHTSYHNHVCSLWHKECKNINCPNLMTGQSPILYPKVAK